MSGKQESESDWDSMPEEPKPQSTKETQILKQKTGKRISYGPGSKGSY